MSKMPDPIFQLIEQERRRQTEGIELIASENFVSDAVMQAQGSVLTNKYAEGYPNNRYYGGCEVVDKVELEAIDRLKKLFGLEWANVQPHSGSQANAAVMFALLKPGDAIMGFELAHGGHLTHGSPVNFSGILYSVFAYRVDKESKVLDYEHMEEVARRHKPKLLIAGASSYSRDWDYPRMRALADEIGAILMADIAHPAGLIAAGLLNDPFEHCHVVTSTTHKTLRGPRGGVIMMKKDFPNPWGDKTKRGDTIPMSRVFDKAVFPGTQGGPLEHVIGAKAVAFGEALTPEYKSYVAGVKENASSMAECFSALGYDVVSRGTDNHLLMLDLTNKDISGKEAEVLLGKISITVNKNMVPFDQRSPFVTSGIRLGTAAVTTRGFRRADIEKTVEYIDAAFKFRDSEQKLKHIKSNINAWMSTFPLFANQ